jgi:hypothetical protein
MRDKLIELLDNLFVAETTKTLGDMADYLIANGVILPESLKIKETKYIPPSDKKNVRPLVLVLLECGEKTFDFAVPIDSEKSISCLGCLYLKRRQKICNRCSRGYSMRDHYTTEPPQEEA